MSHVLVKFSGDYADEFSVYGFQVFTEADWNSNVEQLKSFFQKRPELGNEVYFGTNEAMYWGDFKDFLRDITVTKITEDEANVLNKLFGTGEFGHVFIEQLLERGEEDEDEYKY